jgi:glycine/D-amino acid oxidase-like deaminating enzyme
MNQNADIIVIGAGLAGLGCAARCAREGWSVTVLERASRLGGRGQSPPIGGVPLNLGAHALYLGGPAERWLASLGVRWSGFQPRPTDTWLADGDEVFPSPTSVLALLGARAFALGERLGLLRLLGMLHRMDPRTLTGTTATDWLDRVAPGPRARRFLEMLVRLSTYTNAPDLLPASIAVGQLQRTVGLRAKGVAYVDGGWETLVSGLADETRRAGARVVTDAHVQAVGDDGRVVLQSDEAFMGRHVIVALPYGGARVLFPDLPERPSLRAACMDLVLAEPTSRRLLLGVDEPYYWSVHSPASEPGRLRAHALRYLAPGESGADAYGALEAWRTRVVPDAKIVAQRFLPEMDVHSALPSEAPARGRIAFAGDWCAPGQLLLDAVAASSEAAVERVTASLAARTAA